MAVREIRLVPDPVLRRKARTVKVVDAAIRKLARDMIDTMQAAKGVGLAANQVGELVRVVTIQLPEDEPFVMINPVITHREGTRTVEEGCLSVPGYTGNIERSVVVKARFIDENSSKHRIATESSLLGQAIEHELDHLNGILYLDHLKSHEDLKHTPEEHEHDDVDFSGPPDLEPASGDAPGIVVPTRS